MSSSWVDPHFAALYARREEERLAERLLVDAEERAERLPELGEIAWRHAGWLECDRVGDPRIRLT